METNKKQEGERGKRQKNLISKKGMEGNTTIFVRMCTIKQLESALLQGKPKKRLPLC